MTLISCSNDENNGGAIISPPSSELYDYRYYAENSNRKTDINGFWVVIERVQYTIDYSDGWDFPKALYEQAYLLSLYEMENGDIKIAAHSNFGLDDRNRVTISPVDNNHGSTITWGFKSLFFKGTSIMKGELIFPDPLLISTYQDSGDYRVLADEMVAIKIADFPDGTIPNSQGYITLEDPLLGTFSYTLLREITPELPEDETVIMNYWKVIRDYKKTEDNVEYVSEEAYAMNMVDSVYKRKEIRLKRSWQERDGELLESSLYGSYFSPSTAYSSSKQWSISNTFLQEDCFITFYPDTNDILFAGTHEETSGMNYSVSGSIDILLPEI